MATDDRSRDILRTYKADSAWDPMLEFMNMSELERTLLSVQLHLVDAMGSDSALERGIELQHAWHELDQVMHDLLKERKSNGV